MTVAQIALATRVALSVFLAHGGLSFALSARAARSSATGHHDLLGLAIGWTEAIAGVLFIIPATLGVGAGLLLAVLAAAALIHGAQHQFRADLVIYMLVVVLLVALEGSPSPSLGTGPSSPVRTGHDGD